MSEFTPGPWQYRSDGILHGRHYYAILSDDSTEIAYTRSGNYAIENGEANARLIAAAPKLLKALQSLNGAAGLYRFTCDCDNDPAQLFAAQSIANAAIAEALGQPVPHA